MNAAEIEEKCFLLWREINKTIGSKNYLIITCLSLNAT